jgi:Mg-chelatase subunit ChlD
MKVTGASETEMGAMMVPLAQRYGAQPDKPETVEQVAKAVDEGGQGVMTEQQLVTLQKAGQAQGFSAAVPASGTMVLDYPLAALSADESAQEAGDRLAEFLAGAKGEELLADNGFRDAENTPLPSGKGLGKGELDTLPAPDAQAATDAMRQWAVLTVPSRLLAVVDVSGSMDFVDGRQSRISLAIAAAEGALKLFPDNGQIGLWAFSVGLGEGNRDYTSLVPIRKLDEEHRSALGKALRKLPTMTDGGTGLYDSALAAIRTLQDEYDARSINNVIFLTDGANDDPGSLTLDELVDTIERERDPARPVRVIAIGLGPEADAKALAKIADATGGRSYVARNPADIGDVFIDAMLSR